MAGNEAYQDVISESETGQPRWQRDMQERKRLKDRQDHPWTVDRKGITYRGLGKQTDVRLTGHNGAAWLELTSKF